MLHGSAFVQYVRESGPRGNYQFGSANWVMAEATRPVAGGTFGIRAMASAEFLTLTAAGYPQLLQVAQPYRGSTLTDRMHPHELVSEAAVTFEHAVAQSLRATVYVGAVGEPALGPVAYLHRPSAVNDPTAPLGHHAQDVTHESFGVAIVGLFSRRVHLEASVFNGAHPDDVRTNFEYAGARFNAVSARLTVNPNALWSVSGSAAYLPATGGAHAHESLNRFGLSVMSVVPRAAGVWATSLVWGANVPTATRRVLQSALIETNLDLDAHNAVFGRAEYFTRTAEDLGLVGSVSPDVELGFLALGYARRLRELRGVGAWLGVRGSVYFVPEQLRLFYGSRTPTGFIAYLQLRPPLIAER